MTEKMLDPKCPFCNQSVSDTAGEYGLLVHLDSECEGNFKTRPIEDKLRAEIKSIINLDNGLLKHRRIKLEKVREFIRRARAGRYESLTNSYWVPANALVALEGEIDAEEF